jgi:hypothetical protein
MLPRNFVALVHGPGLTHRVGKCAGTTNQSSRYSFQPTSANLSSVVETEPPQLHATKAHRNDQGTLHRRVPADAGHNRYGRVRNHQLYHLRR